MPKLLSAAVLLSLVWLGVWLSQPESPTVQTVKGFTVPSVVQQTSTSHHSHSERPKQDSVADRVNAFNLPSHIAADYSIGQAVEFFLSSGERITGKVTDKISVDLSDQSGGLATPQINSVFKNLPRIIVSLGERRGSLELISDGNHIIEAVLYDVETDRIFASSVGLSGTVSFVEQDKNAYLCLRFPEAELAESDISIGTAPAELIADINRLRNLQSNPDADKVIYIDYWGGQVTGTAWNSTYTQGAPIDYDPFSRDSDVNTFSQTERYLIWLGWMEAAEDYAAFDVNVTTSEAIYDSTPRSRRSKLIVTNSDEWFPFRAGGVAYVGVYGFNSDFYATAWVWNLSASSLGMTISHESGHQMGLRHDGISGQDYYGGHAGWGPIMGAPFGQPYVQWSKGEYPDASNQQDDIELLDQVLSYAVEDASNDANAPTALTLPVNRRLANIGLRQSNDNADHYSFQLDSTQNVTIDVITILGDQDEQRAGNLAIKISLVNTSSDTVVESVSAGDLSPLSPLTNKFGFSTSLGAGSYRLSIEPDSPDFDPLTGFDNYGNGGLYRMSITAELIQRPDLVTEQTSLSNTEVALGESISLSAVVRNQGNQASQATTLRYYRSDDSIIDNSDTQVAVDSILALDGDGTSAQSASFSVPAESGVYWYGVCVDAVSNESNTDNNCSIGSSVDVVPPVDLLTENFQIDDISLNLGQAVGLSALVRNVAQTTAPASVLRFYLSSDAQIGSADQQVAEVSVAALTTAAQSLKSVTVSALLAEGQVWYGACVDVVADEQNTANNCTDGVAVQVTNPPDLTVLSTQLNNNQVNPTQPISVAATVRNLGTDTSAPSVVRYYFSSDTSLSVDDTQFDTQSVLALTQNATSIKTSQTTAPAPGDHWVISCVDSVVEESNTSNNCSPAVALGVVSGDRYEEDDESELATELSERRGQVHSIVPVGDVDWLKVTLTEASPAQFVIYNASGDPQMRVYDQSLNLIAPDRSELLEDGVRFEFDTLGAGTYYLEVVEDGGDAAVTSYTVQAIFSLQSFVANDCEFFQIMTPNGSVSVCL